jgi:hypothetical protein
MPLITLRGYLFDQLGNGVGDIEVNAYAKNSDGTWVGTPAASVTSSSTTGKWEIINLDTADAPQTGVFGLRIMNPATGQVRKIEGDTRMMFGQVIGAGGSAPLANLSIQQVHLADGIVSDAKMGTRTIDDTNALASETGTPTQLWSRLANMVKQITGKSTWRTAPVISLETANTTLTSHTASLATAAAHIANTSNPHSTTHAQVGSPTVTDTTAPAVDTNTIQILFSNLANRIKALSGEAGWKDAPDTTLAAAALHAVNTSNPHTTTAAQVGAVANAGTVVKAQSGLLAARPAAATAGNGALYFATDDLTISFSNGSVWTILGTADYNDLSNVPSAPGAPNMFATVLAGGNSLVPESPTDVLNFSAGPGISIVGSVASDTVSISASGYPFGFASVAVSGQSTISADAETDTLNIAAGAGISLTTVAGTDTLTIAASGGTIDADTVQGNDGDLYPFMSAVQALGAEPALATGPWKIQAGNVSADFVSGDYNLALSGTVNGYVTIQLMIQHPTTGIVGIDNSPAPTTGASPTINCTLHDAAGTAETRTVVLYYFVIHW